MKYLLRAARRLEPGPPSARPAIPSRSPLAEADQRLNLDSFASRFDLPFNVREQASPPAFEEETGHTPAGVQEFANGSSNEAPRSTDARHPATTSESAGTASPHEQTADRPTRRRPGRESPAPASSQPEAHTARRPERLDSESSETPTAPESLKVTRPQRAQAQAQAQAGRRPNALPDPSADALTTRTPAPDITEGVRLATAQQAPPREAEAESVFEALSRAVSWVERGGRRAFDEEAAEGQVSRPAPAPHTRHVEAAAAWPARATPRDTRPVTHLEIGKIEVEVVAPPRTAHNSAPPRPAQGSDGFGRALRQTFGWRQR